MKVVLRERNDQLRFSCPYCPTEYLVIGVDIDHMQNYGCPNCGGCCGIAAMDMVELLAWIRERAKFSGVYDGEQN